MYIAGLKNIAAGQEGVAVVFVALTLAVLVGFIALAIDVGHLLVCHNQLQNAADAAALAGARILGKIYQGDTKKSVLPMLPQDQENYNCSSQLTFPTDSYEIGGNNDCEVIVNQSRQAAAANEISGTRVDVLDGDVEIGKWTGAFTKGDVGPDAVRVTIHRDAATTPIATFFAKIFGVSSMNASASATAALTGVSEVNRGLPFPIAIAKKKFMEGDDWCNSDITFYPADDSAVCGGWTNFEDNKPVTDSDITSIINAGGTYRELTTIADGDPDTKDEIYIKSHYDLAAGNNFNGLLMLFKYHDKAFDVDENGKARIDDDGKPVDPSVNLMPHVDKAEPLTEQDPYYEPNGSRDEPDVINNPPLQYPYGEGPRYKHEWQIPAVVYDADDCSENEGKYKVAGFAAISVRDILEDPPQSGQFIVKGKVLCDYVNDADVRGNGTDFGNNGSIPSLVE